jgi:hypothetical protein
MANIEQDGTEFRRWQNVVVGAFVVFGLAGVLEVQADIPALSVPIEGARFLIDTVF